jgi:hypothetical protein
MSYVGPDADEVKEEPSEFDDDDYEYRSILIWLLHFGMAFLSRTLNHLKQGI